MYNIAIIIARSGSKRIKNKNIINFFSKPIISFSILEAKKTNIFDKIFVSSDSKKYLNISKKYGADDYDVRKNFSNDNATTLEVMSYEIKRLQKKKFTPNYVCCIYPAAPLIKSTDILKGYKKIKTNKFSYVFSAGKYPNNLEKAFSLNKKNNLDILFSKSKANRLLEKKNGIFFDAAQFYWGKFNCWKKREKIFSNKSSIIEIPRERLQDINNHEDLDFSKKLFLINKLLSKRKF